VLLSVPNFSEGRDASRVKAVTAQFASGAELLDSHSDPVHNRTVLTLAAPVKRLGEALSRGAGACAVAIDMRRHEGAHPCIGALDVCPVVWTGADDRPVAREEGHAIGEAIAGEGIPVFFYGELASAPERAERAYFRNGGLDALTDRMANGELAPDLGPARPHPTAGATLVTARPPIAAFNVLLEGADRHTARAVAAKLRESGGGLSGVRAIAVDLGEAGMQISTNVHDPVSVPLAAVVDRVRDLASPHGARPASAEIVGLVPRAALEGFPPELAIPGFDPDRHVLERRR